MLKNKAKDYQYYSNEFCELKFRLPDSEAAMQELEHLYLEVSEICQGQQKGKLLSDKMGLTLEKKVEENNRLFQQLLSDLEKFKKNL